MNLSPEDLFIQRRLSGIARQLSGIAQNLEEFGRENPQIIAPNVLEAMVGNLKDDINVILREVNMIASPNRKELRERRYVCRSCNNVFMTPLAAGVCDECRSRGITTSDLSALREQEVAGEPEPPDGGEAPLGNAPGDDPLAEADGSDSEDPFAT